MNSSLSSVNNSQKNYITSYNNLMSKYRHQKSNLEVSRIERHFKDKNVLMNDQIASGPNSMIFLGKQSSSGRIFCIKIILKKMLEQLGGCVIKRSLDYVKLQSCSYLTTVAEFASIGPNYFTLVTDYYPNGSLAQLLQKINPLPQDWVKTIFQSVLQGLSSIHSFKMAHRNLKLENILLDEQMRPVISDFSFTIVTENVANFESVLATSLPYLAPEVNSGIPYDPIPADIWSFGVCLFIALNNSLPFGNSGKWSQPIHYKLKPEVERVLTFEAKKCLDEALQFDVNKRSTAIQLQNEAWFQK
ncbi:spermatid differentiation [Blomia tropicalis]|nr:spermatid differentiation [Blomia tropicalis]